MSTIIRLRGINFNNPALPVVSSFVRNGLVGAFRPAGDASSMVDLSGNGVSLTKRGSPAFTQYGMTGTPSNGYRTNIPETLNSTLTAIFRVTKGTTFSSMAVGNYNNDNVGAERGMSIWTSSAAGTGAGKIDVRVNAQTHYKKTADGLYTNSIAATILNDEVDDTTFLQTEWVFAACVVDATNNKLQAYLPKLSALGPTAEVNYTTASQPGSLANRLIADPVTLTPNYFEILSTPDANWVSAGTIELAEVLIYNRALAFSEILEQYNLSKDFMKKVRNIVI